LISSGLVRDSEMARPVPVGSMTHYPAAGMVRPNFSTR
jgi:hypothetical protein